LEIDRLSRVLDRKGNHWIDYNEFIDHLEGPNLPPLDPLKSTAGRLEVFLQQNDMTAGQLLKKLGNRVPIEKFSKFLKKKVQKNFSEELLDEIALKFDVNKDGAVDLEDLKSILESKSYLELQTGNPYPSQALTPSKAREVLKTIRKSLIDHKVSIPDAFRAFDTESLGVLNAKQFSSGLSRYVDLSEPVKNGLFALIDKLGTGLITQEAFLSVIKDTNLAPKASNDSWTWETETIDRMRKWIKASGVSVENAFRAFDSDFDGIVSKEDLKSSLLTILKLTPQECDSSRVDRLYKLIDHFKRNSVQLSDFKLLFEEGEKPEWKKSAKQQVGLFISRNYPTVKLAFEAVSELTGKIRLDQFSKWVEQHQILKGFNLTQELTEKLFAELDPHRKAYMTENDFCLAFGGINYQSQCIQEIKDAIRSNFQDVQSAFDYFTSGQKI
jgi:Ca2+-binding EF-hand superfamily protein